MPVPIRIGGAWSGELTAPGSGAGGEAHQDLGLLRLEQSSPTRARVGAGILDQLGGRGQQQLGVLHGQRQTRERLAWATHPRKRMRTEDPLLDRPPHR